MEIRTLAKKEYAAGLTLAWTVFQQYEAPEYCEQGVQSFYAAIHDPVFTDALTMYGAFADGQLIGMLATRGGGEHIALFFVEGAFHRQGVGKRLFARACADNVSGSLTVNASPYAVEVYHRLGFRDTAAEQLTDGIRYTPMTCRLKNPDCPCKRTRCSRHGDCAACRAHHKDEKQQAVFCERPPKREKRGRER
ncbi:MAG: GNAT family N-acetyltransferase [Eubacteriales bacterium]|nr:GNAT family N-acetyltransferase [Eubacteriales bacterium]